MYILQNWDGMEGHGTILGKFKTKNQAFKGLERHLVEYSDEDIEYTITERFDCDIIEDEDFNKYKITKV